MGKRDKEHNNGTPTGPEEMEGQENEKLFDFDKVNPDLTEESLQAPPDQNEKVKELQATVSELKDKQLRLLAEFENYKKRTMRERLDLLGSASRDVIVALLPILDDFERAKKHADDPETGEHFSEGVNLVYNRLNSTLQSLGLKVMDSTNQPFDPDMHDAITEVPVPNEDLKGKVIDTIEKGYLLNDKIIRHAKVVVGK
jgi:molecular chaperone GrpE